MTLPHHLQHLEAARLIQLTATAPELAYAFRHALDQDAAYGALLRQQRRRWHRAVAEVLEDLYRVGGAVPAALAPILAHHYATAGDAARALPYFTQAGEAAFARYANTEAAAHFARAVALALAQPASTPTELGQAGTPVAPTQLRHLFTRLGRATELSAPPAAALRVYTQMEAAGLDRADPALRLAALMARATVLSVASLAFDEAGALAALEQARALARDLNDHAAEAHINWTLMLRNTVAGGDPYERLALAEAALHAARTLGLREQLAYVLTDLWYATAGLGRWDEALAALLEAQALWRTLANPALLSECLSRAAITQFVTGDYAAAHALFDQAYAVAEQMENPHSRSLSRMFAGLVELERGEIAATLALMAEVIALGEQTGNISALIGTRAELALALGAVGQLAAGLAVAQQALDAGRQFTLLRPWAQAAAARLLARQGDHAAAAAHLAELDFEPLRQRTGFMAFMWGGVGLAQVETTLRRGDAAGAAALAERLLSAFAASGVVYLLPEALTLHGRALLALSQPAAARAALEAARDRALALGARRHLGSIFGLLAAATTAATAADHLRHAAQAEVDWLAEQIPPALRSSFRAHAAADTAAHGSTA